MTYLLFVIGFVILIKGADLLVDGSSSLAKQFHISDLVIGLTIVAFGTSAPELVVNLIASYKGNTELAVTNVLGSNIANTFIAVGAAAIITPLTVQRNTVSKEIPLSVLAGLVVAFVCNDVFLNGDVSSRITRGDGLVLLSFFAVFFVYTLTIAKRDLDSVAQDPDLMSPAKAVVFIILGLAGLTVGGDWIVNGAIAVARVFGMSEALIGLTVVAVGTSLPEIVTSCTAAYKGRKDIAIGNAVGSNIFNVFWVLGLSSVIRELPFDSKINLDVAVNLLAGFLLFAFLFIRNRTHTMGRVKGVLFLFFYAAYISIAIWRG
ncbi:MAG: calcium/sodium antiporter [Deltaproteobacteria bacterium]|nr:calcium/sodium antiporter [Deltaproteobacteria bacterium]